MYKGLKIAVPAIQLLAAFVFALPKYYHNIRFYEYHLNDIHNFQSVVVGLNFPVVALWVVIFLPLAYIPSLNGTLPPPAVTISVAILLALSVALFWYLVVTEIEMRTHGRSMLRFSGWLKKGTTLIVLLSFGIGSLVYGYVESWPLRHARPTEAVLVGIFPAIWGTVFIGMGMHDLVMSLRRER
jgi:hypothetical protein